MDCSKEKQLLHADSAHVWRNVAQKLHIERKTRSHFHDALFHVVSYAMPFENIVWEERELGNPALAAQPLAKHRDAGIVALKGQAAFATTLCSLNPIFVRHRHSLLGVASEKSLDSEIAQIIYLLKAHGIKSVELQARRVDSTFLATEQVLERVKVRLQENGIDVVISRQALTRYVLSFLLIYNMLFWGLDERYLMLSPRVGGMVHYKIDAFVSRAAAKLREVFDLYGHILNFSSPRALEKRIAFDLGASPGGWTDVLVREGFFVHAIDPAPLDKELQAHPAVQHWVCKAEDFFLATGEKFDLLTCDVNWEPKRVCAIVCGLAERYARRGALGIITLKLPKNQVTAHLTALLAEYQNFLKIKLVRHLFHNRHEVTLIGEFL